MIHVLPGYERLVPTRKPKVVFVVSSCGAAVICRASCIELTSLASLKLYQKYSEVPLSDKDIAAKKESGEIFFGLPALKDGNVIIEHRCLP